MNTDAMQRKKPDLEGELLAGAQVVNPICDDMMYADPNVAKGQQVLLTQFSALLQQIAVMLKVQHSLHFKQAWNSKSSYMHAFT